MNEVTSEGHTDTEGDEPTCLAEYTELEPPTCGSGGLHKLSFPGLWWWFLSISFSSVFSPVLG